VEVDRRGDALTLTDLMNVVHFCRSWSDVVALIEDYRSMGTTAIILGTGLDRALMKEYAENLLAVF